MKPNWKDAPEWANYLAQDEDSVWYWFENKPQASIRMWMEYKGEYKIANPSKSWKKSLEKKP